MQALFNGWRDSGFDVSFRFQATHAVWDEPARFAAIVGDAAPHGMRRVKEIRLFKPPWNCCQYAFSTYNEPSNNQEPYD